MTDLPCCEICGESLCIPIFYGVDDPEVLEWHQKGWGFFGGDCVCDDYGFHCVSCGHEFGRRMPSGDFEVWIMFHRAKELLSHDRRIEAIQMLRTNSNLSIKDCLEILNNESDDALSKFY